MLPQNVTNYFMTVFKHYLAFNKIREYETHLNSIWVNEMKQHEYNPAHIHRGTVIYWTIKCDDFKITINVMVKNIQQNTYNKMVDYKY